jgi:tetratricopeptide (TPR) repeat protein
MNPSSLFPCRRIVALAGLSFILYSPLFGATADTSAATDKNALSWSQSVDFEKKSDYASAITKINEFIRNGGDAYLGRLRGGWLYYENRDYPHAEEYYQVAASHEPKAVTPLLGLAYSYRAGGDDAKAETTCRDILKRDPGNTKAFHILGMIYFDRKDYRNASLVYDQILALSPEDTDAISGAAWAKYYLNDLHSASGLFNRLVMLSPDYSHAKDGQAATAGS